MAVDMIITTVEPVKNPITKALIKSTIMSPVVTCSNTFVTTTTVMPSANSNTATLIHKGKQKVDFFSLPGELRNKIYRLALPKKGDIVLAGMP